MGRGFVWAGLFVLAVLCSVQAGCISVGLGTYALVGKGGATGRTPGAAPQLLLEGRPDRSTTGTVVLSFRVLDAQATPLDLSVHYTAQSASTGASRSGGATLLGPTEQLESHPEGREHSIAWDYAADLGPGAFLATLELQVSKGETSSLPQSIAEFVVGNDAPRVISLEVTGSSGFVLVEFELADSTDDRVSVEPFYSVDSGPLVPIASVAGTLDNQNPGTPILFGWDTVADLGSADLDAVSLHLLPRDEFGAVGPTAVSSAAFSLDNNSPPTVSLVPLIGSPDDGGDIAVQFRLFDLESDLARVVIEAARDPSFADAFVLLAAAVDAWGRAERSLGALAADEIFAPALVLSVPLRGGVHPFVGKRVEVLENPAQASILGLDGAGIVLENPASALVTAPSLGAVLRVALPSGALETVATGLGTPEHLAREVADDGLLVVDAAGGRLLRLDLENANLSVLVPGTLPAVRALASLGSHEALLLSTAGRLLHVDYRAEPALMTPWLEGLVAPRGLALDPHPRTAWLSENGPTPGEQRITRIDLMSLQTSELYSAATNGPPAPGALFLAGDGHTLYGITEEGGASRLFAVQRTRPAGGFGYLAEGLEAPRALSADPGDGAIYLLDGGTPPRLIRQSLGRNPASTGTIRAVTASSLLVDYDTPGPASPPPAGTRLRVRGGSSEGLSGLRTSPAGVQHTVVLALEEHLNTPDRLYFRVTPFDADPGISAVSGPLHAFSRGRFADAEVWELPSSDSVPTDALLADFNGDGNLDLACTHRIGGLNSAGGVTLFFGDEAGGVLAGTTLELTHHELDLPRALAAGDLTGDGWLDLAVVGETSGNLVIFAGPLRPSGAPPQTQTIPLSDSPFDVALADFDRDGRLDLAVANQGSGQLILRLQDESPGPDLISLAPALELGIAGVTGLAVGDIDGDGDLDIVTANVDEDTLQIVEQSARGQFQLGATLPSPEEPVAVVLTDIDRDGDLDIVSLNQDSAELRQFRNEPGGWAARPPLTLGATTTLPTALAAGDLDGDGRTDLVVGGRFPHLLAFFQTESGTYATPRRLEGPPDVGHPSAVALGDLDGDGRLDVVSTSTLGSRALVVHRQSRGHFREEPVILSQGSPQALTRVALGDMDADGDLDVVNVGQTAHIRVVFQVSPGVYAPPVSLLDPDDPQGGNAVALADLDGDGDLDIVTTHSGTSDSVKVLIQTAPGTFDPEGGGLVALTEDTELDDPTGVACGDLDGDGDLDIAVASRGAFTLFWNDAGAFCAQRVSDPLIAAGQDIALADVDQDGSLDVVLANRGGDLDPAILMFCQLGPGQFAAPLALQSGPGIGAAAVAVEDLDGDGDLDLVASNVRSRASVLSVFWQLDAAPGGPRFSRPLELDTGSIRGPQKVVIADFDRDGDLDLATAHSGDGVEGRLVVFDQTAPRRFGPARALEEGLETARPQGIAAGDLDGDGVPDLVVANAEVPNLVVVYQR